jgi:hypothetical protein
MERNSGKGVLNKKIEPKTDVLKKMQFDMRVYVILAELV